jgi:hypothetical protein
MHAQIDRNIQHLGTFGEIHAQKEDVAPGGMGEIHANRRGFAQDWIGAVDRMALEQFGAQTQRMIGRMPHAEHPLIAADGADASAHLIGQGLKRQPMIRRGQGGANGVAGPVHSLRGQEIIDGFLEPALEQMFETTVGHASGRAGREAGRQMKTVN